MHCWCVYVCMCVCMCVCACVRVCVGRVCGRCMASACGSPKLLRRAASLFKECKAVGSHAVEPLYHALVTAFARAGAVEKAVALLDTMRQDRVVPSMVRVD